MKKILMTGLWMLASNFLGSLNSQKSSGNMTKLKLSMWYLQGIKTLRLLMISFLGIGVCLVFLLSGLILFHLALLLYAPWETGVKLVVTLLCAALYILLTWVFFSYVFSEENWLRIFNADRFLEEVLRSMEEKTVEEPEQGTGGNDQ